MAIALVTDSTSCIPAYRLAADNIRVQPVVVTIGERSFLEGIDIDSQLVLAAIQNGDAVSTSRPNPASFAQTYSQLKAEGFDEIISVHLSAEISGTYEAAVIGARESGINVQVIDSRTVGLGLGFAVLAALDAVRVGVDVPTVCAVAAKVAGDSRTWVVVENLEQLRKGGRVNLAQAAIGSALSVKPILQVLGGKVVPLEKVRTASRAHDRVVELACNFARASRNRVQIGLQHAGAPERVAAIASKIGRELPGVAVVTADMGAVLTAHVGMGAISITVSQAPDL
jgi:DegV family protein with EDD domain